MTAPEQPTPEICAVRAGCVAAGKHGMGGAQREPICTFPNCDTTENPCNVSTAILTAFAAYHPDRFAAQRAAEAVEKDGAIEAYVNGPLPDCMMPDGGDACVAYQQLQAAFARAETDAFLRGRANGLHLAELEKKYGSFTGAATPPPGDAEMEEEARRFDENLDAQLDKFEEAVTVMSTPGDAGRPTHFGTPGRVEFHPAETPGDAGERAREIADEMNCYMIEKRHAGKNGSAYDKLVGLIAAALQSERTAAASQAQAERDAVILRLTRRLADAEQRTSQVRRELLIKLCNECDRIKATFPGNKKHGLYDPGDARTVWDCACDRLRATICALTTPQESVQTRRVRYARYCGPMDAAECQRIMLEPLYQLGDAILVWVNEGDILASGEEVAIPQESV